MEWKAADEEKVNIADIKSETAQDQMLIEKAKQTELEKLHLLDTFDEVEDHGQKNIINKMGFYWQRYKYKSQIGCTGF